jgi:ActR/RegA family two-component response regulator
MSEKKQAAVLIVDDDRQSRKLLSDLLSNDFDVSIAGNFRAAMNILRTQNPPFHVAVVDIRLNDSDTANEEGLSLIEELNRSGKYTNAIVVTGFSTLQREKKALRDLGVFDYFEKNPRDKIDFDHKEFCRRVQEAAADAESRRQVFVLMPFAEKYLAIYEHVVKEVVKSNGIVCKRADDFFEPCRVMDDVRRGIRDAKFVIADLSGRSPNVFYEVGLAHAIGQTALLLTQSLDDVPPKLRDVRNIIYTNTLDGAAQLRRDLAKAIQSLHNRKYRIKPLFPFKDYQPDPKLCVALVPDTDLGRKVYTNIIREAVTTHDLNCKSHRSIFSMGHIMDEIWEQLNKARIIMADLSGKDPDVFYLTGISHGLKKDVILLADKEEDIPFDFRGQSHVIYSYRTFSEGLESKQHLSEVLELFLNGKQDRE